MTEDRLWGLVERGADSFLWCSMWVMALTAMWYEWHNLHREAAHGYLIVIFVKVLFDPHWGGERTRVSIATGPDRQRALGRIVDELQRVARERGE